MIQENELRIGNVIEANTPPMIVQAINKDSVELYMPGSEADNFEEDLEKCNGIPLTPEILEKCGFEWDIFWQRFADKRGRYYLQEANDSGYNIFNGKWKQQINWMKSLEYLHQLQNLYFALTGEELTVKL